MAPTEAVLIDWGTTNARAFAVDRDGRILDRRASPLGIRNVEGGNFAGAFDALVGDWPASAGVPVLMSGMIGSRQGWVEAAYLPCPAGAAGLAGALKEVPGRPHLRIVPGVSFAAAGGHFDVLRGEEVQCFGALATTGHSDAVVCLPGTHSKWVVIEGRRIVRFSTSMTGETYAVMRRHSILAALMPAAADTLRPMREDRWFTFGLDRSGEPGGLLSHLFSVRADALFDVVPPSGLEDYLSGILVGHEIRAMSRLYPAAGPVLVVGGETLSATYCAALARLGIASQSVDAEQATATGLFQVFDATRRP